MAETFRRYFDPFYSLLGIPGNLGPMEPHLAGHNCVLHFLYWFPGLFSSQNWSPTGDSSSTRTHTAVTISIPVEKKTNFFLNRFNYYSFESCVINSTRVKSRWLVFAINKHTHQDGRRVVCVFFFAKENVASKELGKKSVPLLLQKKILLFQKIKLDISKNYKKKKKKKKKKKMKKQKNKSYNSP